MTKVKQGSDRVIVRLGALTFLTSFHLTISVVYSYADACMQNHNDDTIKTSNTVLR